jgi:hypothetical protein
MRRFLLGRLLRREGGTVAIEFAMVFPLFIMMMLGIVEFGRFLWADNTLRHAVQEGARCAALHCCEVAGATCETPQEFAALRAAGLNVTEDDFLLDSDTCGMRMRAGADGEGMQFTFVAGEILGLAGVDLRMRAEACFPSLDG